MYNKFKNAIEKDREFIKDWMIEWDYQKKKGNFFDNFNGHDDLIYWINWIMARPKPNFLDIYDLTETSFKIDFDIIPEISTEEYAIEFKKNVSMYNAQDYYFANMLPYPSTKLDCVLDFGAGYGRHANLWTHLNPEIKFIAIDGIAKSYCVQNHYYKLLNQPLYEYLEDEIEINRSGIYHIPTWRFDLVEDNTVDKVLLTQVIGEINEQTVYYLINNIFRVLKPNGILYIRDHKEMFQPAHKLDIDDLLKLKGFSLVYEDIFTDLEDIHGLPRIYRK